ncbi:MAG: orotidine-5'-phosphate decarboxylase [Candidatus Magasanikbacteria bacterium]|nr:orotidine-5'-phosphate decarboxylase [Candidatus Magasanikbacteria bacterium]
MIMEKIKNIIAKNNSLVCVGLDSEVSKLPAHLKNSEFPQFEFNKAIIDATADLVCAYKPNTAFYEAQGEQGIKELKMTCDYLKEKYPDILLILDAKRADIGNTNNGYVKFVFDYLNADMVTLHPYLGQEALAPFLDRADKGSVILCRTSNPGAGEFQDLRINNKNLFEIVAEKIIKEWNTNNNCLLVVGATYPEELELIRSKTDTMFFLVPGVGAQGGDLEKTLASGLNSEKSGLIISSSRGIIFADNTENFAVQAREESNKLKEEINKYR